MPSVFVQAFLSLSHGRFSVGSGKHLPLTPHGSMGVKQIRRAPQNLERLGQSAWKFGLSNCIAGAPICPINSDGDGDATTRDVGSPKHAARSCLKEKHAELVPTENRKKRARQVMGSEGLQSRHANPVDDPTFDFEGKKTLKALRRGRHSNLRSRLRCSVSGSTAKGLLDYYPSRPNSPEEPVSLMSPRMWKKIRRLPAPGEVERDTLQVRALPYGSVGPCRSSIGQLLSPREISLREYVHFVSLSCVNSETCADASAYMTLTCAGINR